MAEACEELIRIEDPLSEKYIQKFQTESSIHLVSKPVPLWVVACIYEARPNVTVDLAIPLYQIRKCLCAQGWITGIRKQMHIYETSYRMYLRNMDSREIAYLGILKIEMISTFADSNRLCRCHHTSRRQIFDWFCRENSLVPTIETGAGVVHIYVDSDIKQENFEKVQDIIINAKSISPIRLQLSGYHDNTQRYASRARADNHRKSPKKM